MEGELGMREQKKAEEYIFKESCHRSNKREILKTIQSEAEELERQRECIMQKLCDFLPQKTITIKLDAGAKSTD